VRDLVLDDVGAPVPARVEDDLRVREVGDRVQRDVLDRHDREHDEHRRHEEDEKAVPRRELDEPRDHLRFSRADLRRDSESRRKFAPRATVSPSERPERISRTEPAWPPVTTSRGRTFPSAPRTKTILRVPLSITASSGTTTAFRGRPSMRTSA